MKLSRTSVSFKLALCAILFTGASSVHAKKNQNENGSPAKSCCEKLHDELTQLCKKVSSCCNTRPDIYCEELRRELAACCTTLTFLTESLTEQVHEFYEEQTEYSKNHDKKSDSLQAQIDQCCADQKTAFSNLDIHMATIMGQLEKLLACCGSLSFKLEAIEKRLDECDSDVW